MNREFWRLAALLAHTPEKVGSEGVEPSCPDGRQGLNLLCIPFHHEPEVVGLERLELSRALAHGGLNAACLPIPTQTLSGGVGGTRTLTRVAHRLLKTACLPFHHDPMKWSGTWDSNPVPPRSERGMQTSYTCA